MKKDNTTVSQIVRKKLCCGCGTCAGCCPTRAIAMHYSSGNRTYVPAIDFGLCNGCGICLSVCPGQTTRCYFSDAKAAGDADGLQTTWGTFIGCYLGHATDPAVRHRASSGGVIPALAKHFLEENSSSAALSTAMNSSSPFETSAKLCKDFASYSETGGSKYCPAATNSALAQLDGSKIQNLLCIGLPCHLQGIERARNFRPLKSLHSAVSIGLLCGGMRGLEATKWVVKSRGYNVEDVASVRYRGNGWPGFMKITFNNGSPDLTIPYPEYCDNFFESWQPDRCALCLDRTAQCADISVGDAWLEELKRDTNGWSVIVTRSERGERMLHEAMRKNCLTISEMSTDKLRKSQKGLQYLINETIIPTVRIYQAISKPVPTYHLPVIKQFAGDFFKIIKKNTLSAFIRKMTVSYRTYKALKGVTSILRSVLIAIKLKK